MTTERFPRRRQGQTIAVCGALALGMALSGCSKKQSHVISSLHDPATAAQLKSFVAEKKAQADGSTSEAAPEFAAFFAAAEKGDWLSISNTFEILRQRAGQYQAEGTGELDARLHGPRWEAVKEIWGAFYAFGHGDEKYSAAFGNDIVKSVPPGSIYFGGTDPGRFVVTAMEKSQVHGDPFFVLTQNALADPTYLDYARSLYGDKIFIPTKGDADRCFQDYLEDAQRRKAAHQLTPGEVLNTDKDGHPQTGGQVSVMAINARLVRLIMDHNTNQDFYLEESYPLDALYPNLEPSGLILKINREPLAELPEETLQADHDYWTKYIAPIIGDWLKSDTSVAEVAAFAEKIYVKHDLRGFKGDPRFIKSTDAQRQFSKLRSSIAGLYLWRIGLSPSGSKVPGAYIASTEVQKQRVSQEAEFALKQAFALCPSSPEAVYRYANLLLSEGRKSDAVLIAQTASHLDSHFNSLATSSALR